MCLSNYSVGIRGEGSANVSLHMPDIISALMLRVTISVKVS